MDGEAGVDAHTLGPVAWVAIITNTVHWNDVICICFCEYLN